MYLTYLPILDPWHASRRNPDEEDRMQQKYGIYWYITVGQQASCFLSYISNQECV